MYAIRTQGIFYLRGTLESAYALLHALEDSSATVVDVLSSSNVADVPLSDIVGCLGGFWYVLSSKGAPT